MQRCPEHRLAEAAAVAASCATVRSGSDLCHDEMSDSEESSASIDLDSLD
jgi:hypothetical protein